MMSFGRIRIRKRSRNMALDSSTVIVVVAISTTMMVLQLLQFSCQAFSVGNLAPTTSRHHGAFSGCSLSRLRSPTTALRTPINKGTINSRLYGIVADPPSSSYSSSSSSLEGEGKHKQNKADTSAWISTGNGGFLPNILPQQIRLLRQKRINQETANDENINSDIRNGNKNKRSYDQSSKDYEQSHLEGHEPSASTQYATTTSSPAKQERIANNKGDDDNIKRINGIPQVTDIIQYKKEVVDDTNNQIVVVRFYAPWCKACRAVERPYRKLAKELPTVKFVECPVTKDNAYLHQGLGIPSLPYAHIYLPNDDDDDDDIDKNSGTTLVEEMKINKHVFGDFRQTLQTYIDGECPMNYDDDDKEDYNESI